MTFPFWNNSNVHKCTLWKLNKSSCYWRIFLFTGFWPYYHACSRNLSCMLGTEVCHHTVLRALGISLGFSYFVCPHHFVFFQNLSLKYFSILCLEKKVIKKTLCFHWSYHREPLKRQVWGVMSFSDFLENMNCLQFIDKLMPSI